MEINFSCKIDHTKEEGYKHLKLFICFTGYVGVFYQEIWKTIPLEGIDFKNDCIKKGFNYSEGQTNWKCLSYHDSCWRTAINDFIFKHRENINFIQAIPHWYETINLTDSDLNIWLKRINQRT